MPKTVDGKDFSRVTKFIKDVVEPQMIKIVEVANAHLAKQRIHIGCEIQWFIKHVEENEDPPKGS